jgi:TPR repeat protein
VNSELAVSLYERACAGAQVDACINLALLLAEGRGVERDMPRAIGQLERVCREGNARACRIGGVFLDSSSDDSDRTHGNEMLSRACELGDGAGCDYLGTVFRDNPIDGSPADELALRSFETACGIAFGFGCLHAAEMLTAGRGGEADITIIEPYLSQACELGVPAACDLMSAPVN